MRVVFIGLGSNLGNREDYINKAIDYLKKNPNIIVDKISSIIETNPQGFINQGKYLNAVIKLKTSLSAFNLLTELQDIENNLGRVRSFKNAARTIDLDILLYGEEVIDQPGLNL